jgi:Fe-S-cluster containining protein
LADGLIERAVNGRVACQVGCDHCCHQSVGVTPAEAITLVAHARKTFDREQLEALARRVGDARQRTVGLSSSERFSPDHPCPFLDGARCSVYEVRPLACRGVNSLDADECRRELREPKAREAFLAAGVGGRAYLEPIRATHAVSAGLQLGLAELFGLDMQPLDLIAAADALLNGSSEIPEQWIAGHASLDAARGGECSTDATSRELRGAR